MTKAFKALEKHYWSDKEFQMYEQEEKKFGTTEQQNTKEALMKEKLEER